MNGEKRFPLNEEDYSEIINPSVNRQFSVESNGLNRNSDEPLQMGSMNISERIGKKNSFIVNLRIFK